MGTTNKKSRKVKSTKTMFAILDYLAQYEDGRVTEIAAETGIAKSTVHHHLSSLLEEEFIVKEASEYRLGLRCYDLGVRVKQNNRLYKSSSDVLQNLAQAVDEVAWLVVEEHGRAVSLHKAAGENAIQTFGRLGKRSYLHYHAAGKAILAHLSPEERTEIIDQHGLPARTKHTITDPEELETHLEKVRDQGYAVHNDEAVIGARAVGAPITVDGSVIGSVSVAGPANRIQNERLHAALPETVMGAVNEIELKYSYEK